MDNRYSDLKEIVIDKSLNAVAHVIVFVLNILKHIRKLWRKLRKIEFKIIVLTSVTYVSLMIITFFLFFYIKEMISYDVRIMAFVDDIEIGIVENTYTLEGSRMRMENEVNKYVDFDYEFEYDIKYKFINTKQKTFLTKDDCYNYLNNIAPFGIVDMYSLYIDDYYVGSLEEYTGIVNIINEFKAIAASELDYSENNIVDLKLYNKSEIIKERRIKTDFSEYHDIYSIFSNGLIELKFIVVRKEIFTEVIKCEVEYQDSDTLYIGVERQATKGSDGIYEFVYEIEYLGGEAINETLISEGFIFEPDPIIILQGIKEPPPAESIGTFIWPIDMTAGEKRPYITSYFAEQREEFDGDQYHYGIDIVTEKGTYIYASDGGLVDHSDLTPSYGNMVKILHKNGKSTYYAHMDERLVEKGEYVYPGQIIGKVGDTGYATGPHLHFEIREATRPLDPLKFLP